MSYRVFLTDDAARDLDEIIGYIERRDDSGKATRVLEQFEQTLSKLSHSPERGAYPNELLKLGIRLYRQVFFKPFRIIYRVEDDMVYILVIADGRRDMQSLLERRLLEG